MIDYANINNHWTLFLDRDGVINKEKKADYIRNVSELVLYDGVVDALVLLTSLFDRIVVVTNQKGIGKGLMTLHDLNNIHQHLLNVIGQEGGRINKFYFCPDLADDSPNRKPNAGMALQAKADFPDINFSESIMVGNKMSDMLFGRNAGMHTVFLATTNPETPFPDEAVDARFNTLIEFANYLVTRQMEV